MNNKCYRIVVTLVSALVALLNFEIALAEKGHTAHLNAGMPGNPHEVDRTIEIEAYDSMRFSVDDLFVSSEETIRFIVTNKGRLVHEFAIGTFTQQQQHSKFTERVPHLDHETSNSIILGANKTKELIWKFGDPRGVEIACLIPGHYKAGMILPLKTDQNVNR